jgi:hypothetical protein
MMEEFPTLDLGDLYFYVKIADQKDWRNEELEIRNREQYLAKTIDYFVMQSEKDPEMVSRAGILTYRAFVSSRLAYPYFIPQIDRETFEESKEGFDSEKKWVEIKKDMLEHNPLLYWVVKKYTSKWFHTDRLSIPCSLFVYDQMHQQWIKKVDADEIYAHSEKGLKERLQKAIDVEDFETAAEIRDELVGLKKQTS